MDDARRDQLLTERVNFLKSRGYTKGLEDVSGFVDALTRYDVPNPEYEIGRILNDVERSFGHTSYFEQIKLRWILTHGTKKEIEEAWDGIHGDSYANLGIAAADALRFLYIIKLVEDSRKEPKEAMKSFPAFFELKESELKQKVKPKEARRSSRYG